MDAIRPTSPTTALLHELERITGRADTERAAADQATIDDLRREVAELRRAVAHLRAAAGPLPPALRPVVARAVLAAGVQRPPADPVRATDCAQRQRIAGRSAGAGNNEGPHAPAPHPAAAARPRHLPARHAAAAEPRLPQAGRLAGALAAGAAAVHRGGAAQQGGPVRLPDVRAVRAARHRLRLPHDLPEAAAQRPVRRRLAERALRGLPGERCVWVIAYERAEAPGTPTTWPACSARSTTAQAGPAPGSTTGRAATTTCGPPTPRPDPPPSIRRAP